MSMPQQSDLRHICASPTAQQKARAFVDPALRDVASGKTEPAKNAKGPAVQKMQEAL